MSSRSRTKSTAATKDHHQTVGKDISQSKTGRSREKSTRSEDHASDFEKENRLRTGGAKSQSKVTKDGKSKDMPTFCLCSQPDDGSPMVCCSECSEWYHFRCVKLSAEEASELEVYVCPTCTEKTGRRTISECHRFPFGSLYNNARLSRPCTMYIDHMSPVPRTTYSLSVV
ncbi:hypothetical protein BDN67DRAFT_893540 [Paxillus ammoniavirescens]|nr:hypothetical protein BDN67DRAFT_893540 [Paxillus ammoniavirescens]